MLNVVIAFESETSEIFDFVTIDPDHHESTLLRGLFLVSKTILTDFQKTFFSKQRVVNKAKNNTMILTELQRGPKMNEF